MDVTKTEDIDGCYHGTGKMTTKHVLEESPTYAEQTIIVAYTRPARGQHQ